MRKSNSVFKNVLPIERLTRLCLRGYTHRQAGKFYTVGNLSLTGFTLIEIITSLAVMVIGLVGILALFPVGFHASKRAADWTQVGFFAQEKMEEIKMKGFADAKSETEQLPGNKAGIFSREVVTADTEGYDGGLKEITVKVHWTQRGRKEPFEEVFKTYLAENRKSE